MYMKILKKNQIIVFILAVMLVTAGYLSTAGKWENDTLMTSSNTLASTNIDDESIGDAKLVNGGALVENDDLDKNTIKETSAKEVNADDYFDASRLEREKMYSQQLDSYQKIIDSTELSQDQKIIAENEIKKINDNKNAIMIIENLIKTKGFKDIIIFINGNSINAVIKSEKLNQQEIAQLQNIISRELNADIVNIHITNKI